MALKLSYLISEIKHTSSLRSYGGYLNEYEKAPVQQHHAM